MPTISDLSFRLSFWPIHEEAKTTCVCVTAPNRRMMMRHKNGSGHGTKCVEETKEKERAADKDKKSKNRKKNNVTSCLNGVSHATFRMFDREINIKLLQQTHTFVHCVGGKSWK